MIILRNNQTYITNVAFNIRYDIRRFTRGHSLLQLEGKPFYIVIILGPFWQAQYMNLCQKIAPIDFLYFIVQRNIKFRLSK